MNPAYAVAVVSSVVFGTADFLGGIAARRASTLTVTFASGAAGLVSLCIAAPFIRGVALPVDYVWGGAGGLCGGLGVALLYRALAIGPVSVAAPVVSLVALSLPIVVGVALGERPAPLAILGMAFAAGSFPLISNTGQREGPRDPRARRSMIAISLVSGVLVGGFLVCIGRVSRDAGLAPLFAARLTTVVVFAVILLVRRVPAWPTGVVVPTLGAGFLDSFANVAYFVAVRSGPLAIVGTIVSLAPATTVLLARLVLRERWTIPQRFGLVFAGAAIVCVSLG